MRSHGRHGLCLAYAVSVSTFLEPCYLLKCVSLLLSNPRMLPPCAYSAFAAAVGTVALTA